MKRKVWTTALVCTLSVCTLSVCLAAVMAPPHWAFGQTPTDSLVGAYYYNWYDIGYSNPNIPDHWNDSIKGTPFLGYYNSSDPHATGQEILFAMQHGIDFFAVSWIGEGTWHSGDFATIDQNLRSGLLQAPDMSGFKFCLFYETVLVKDNSFNEQKNFSYIFLNDINYAAQQYLSNPSYLKINGSPVFFIYNVPYLYGNSNSTEVQEAHNLLDGARQEAAADGFNLYIIGDVNGGPAPPDPNSPLLYSLNATTSYHFDDQARNWNQVLGNAATYYPQWLSKMSPKGIGFVPNAYPGFDNTNNSGVTVPTVIPPNAKSFGQMLQIALNNMNESPGIVMITSWNEWMEGTMIEPSMENGELFLLAVYDATKPPPASTLTSTPTPNLLSVWLPILSGVLGAIIASVVVTFYFLKQRKQRAL